ncbi:hypothetical protein EXIGLDRAFT_783569 [Exidia glandulosa HHB12029]|uniref:Uncharacterized protein n=1 Tax=Exidia glandulosa HHB12029 TaxID=1314781 RepID=A0A166MZS6_EXIGL|nr:hypothetical protein EXIGLDRAFT_783569 [Exidia glandulosa HHB12029]
MELVRRETFTLREVPGPSDSVAPNSRGGALVAVKHLHIVTTRAVPALRVGPGVLGYP